MKEKFEIPHAERVVGVPAKHQDKQEIAEKYFASFFELEREKKEGIELEKTERDVELISFSDQAVEKYLKQYNSNKDIRIPLENIHLLRDGGTEEFSEGRVRGGSASALYGSIVVDRPQSDIQFTLMAFHELFHAKSYKAFQITTEGEPKVYRSGFSVVSRDGKTTYFDEIDEAITGYMERRFYREFILNSKLLKKEVKTLEKNGEKPMFGRIAEVKSAEQFINQLFELNKDKFKTKDEIFDLFLEAEATGKLLKVGRLVESSLGKGSFRELGEKSAD
ncbi:MAG: hypothetical protein A3B16_02350 [Candidatus Zambryskibacteria bacterium RIFCSPLOWO2_01_FULL_45_43]|uniref:Uncharacterized protein n=2 Tax=Parcubacteria group TaxID=1794811 RepID=A0A1G1ZU58_9BACT|nr:MAG: hypothetical protein A3H63_03120 [Candidatus Harrisonbacteria bacterium RIFCSPLOWO2_02_FULL_45_10c]OHB06430.1 MAG: hypothetical protein A3B16_02350 [Candidatus Zambryskibacteria bacterium RIFCSPLOWO2_01_FULL_45_43]